jgi:hypothetical protein
VADGWTLTDEQPDYLLHHPSLYQENIGIQIVKGKGKGTGFKSASMQACPADYTIFPRLYGLTQ